MKRFLLALLPFLLISAADTPQKAYIEKFAAYAVNEMYRSGIPASITLAQGMLESRNGLSDLAAKGNNHFGIKCHTDWKGATMRVDDETRGECFRVYDSAYQSFQDHSDFLRYRSRYHFLFDYDITDYKSWAYGLSKAGYATDPQYPAKLIKLIEENDLARFDGMKPSDFEKVEVLEEEEIVQSTPDKAARKVKVKKVRKRAKAAKFRREAVEQDYATVWLSGKKKERAAAKAEKARAKAKEWRGKARKAAADAVATTPILVSTGTLRKSFFAKDGAVATSVAYAVHHEFGTMHMDPRPVMPFDQEGNPRSPAVEKAVQRAMENMAKRVLGGK